MPSVTGRRRVPEPLNEPIRHYAPGSAERRSLKTRLASMAGERIDIPLVIGGCEVRTGRLGHSVMPHDHRHVLADWHQAGPEHVAQAIAAAGKAYREWSAWPWEDRAAVFLRAAELLATSHRDDLNASTMLGQSKTAHQAEIDAAAEMIDFWRFNPYYAQELYGEQPVSPVGPGSGGAVWNQLDSRPLEGFVYAVTPFNFTSIGGNLPTAPALMGNTVVWKPASSAMLSAHYIMRLLMDAGLPPGVINMVAGDAASISAVALGHRDLAGVHFTGSTAVFNGMWERIGSNMASYRTYPRIVGETGGKNFILAHPSADPQAVAVAAVRGAFEYQGQKCSAASRLYIPASLWGEVRDRMVAMMREIKVGDVQDFRNFMGAVIDAKAYAKITGYQAAARKAGTIIQGGGARDDVGYFIDPTLVETKDPGSSLMCEEIFGPVVSAYAYADAAWTDTLALIDRTSPYALTGAVFARDRAAIHEAANALRHAAGNFYINDKPTGAVVGQQPFGGSRASGTNDKAGSRSNLMRWISARAIKENFAPPHDHQYPFMGEQ
jgi:1-pyrroline-5-carboxylate dehydrogenase